jgi:hypothetical protein
MTMTRKTTMPTPTSSASTTEPASERSFRLFAGVAAIVSIAPALASLFVALPAVDYDMNTVSDLMLFLRTGARGAVAGRWSMVFDMLGYYLLIAPVIVHAGRRLRERASSWARLATGALMAYVLIGAAGAAILAAALPSLLTAYAKAAAADRLMIETVYRAVTDLVYGGLWNILEELLAGVGWLVFGWLEHARRPRLGKLTMVLGLACLVDGLGNSFQLKAVADAGLYAYLLLAPTWAAYLGIQTLRDR